MTQYLSRNELCELTGTPRRARQISWLTEQGWPFVVTVQGQIRVARAYHDKRLGISEHGTGRATRADVPLNLDAA
ncbi:DUF4224 domain-containing protein [Pandoraea sp.]|uniref:DUF4224 domain-containing protein n=1 Tax=Pandoraea sp. TaxID=1883445 RepID=UPI001205B3E2|nr:DUF4224 domain-containing protein [Pandoraea sp.]TAL53793.1 MAG: DUF4224 domain-containing protein [Pandoraea sp.]TAM17046.1 MAG: DUF4224 domain-containing protein [Pandoraea sp.]